jgi:hypothetical protein
VLRTGRQNFGRLSASRPSSLRTACWIFAVGMLGNGVPLEEVSKLLGHTTVKTTEKHYAPWVTSRQDRLDALVTGTWKQLSLGGTPCWGRSELLPVGASSFTFAQHHSLRPLHTWVRISQLDVHSPKGISQEHVILRLRGLRCPLRSECPTDAIMLRSGVQTNEG